MCEAKAGPAATIIAAITRATVKTKSMRLKNATSFIEGGARQPRRVEQRHHLSKQRVLVASPNQTIFGVGTGLCIMLGYELLRKP